jgi:hypothetical protein
MIARQSTPSPSVSEDTFERIDAASQEAIAAAIERGPCNAHFPEPGAPAT